MKSQQKHENNTIKYWLSNTNLLRIAALTFGLFVIAEIIGALSSGALSLLGDGAAMGIDVITYRANMYCEHIKSHHGAMSKKGKWIFQIAVPVFAVSSLLAVTT